MKSFRFRAHMHSDYSTREAVKTHIAPTSFFHQRLQGERAGKVRERLRQVVVLFKCLADDSSKQRGEPVKVEMEERAKYPAGRVTDFQADDSSSRPHHARQQHASAGPALSSSGDSSGRIRGQCARRGAARRVACLPSREIFLLIVSW